MEKLVRRKAASVVIIVLLAVLENEQKIGREQAGHDGRRTDMTAAKPNAKFKPKPEPTTHLVLAWRQDTAR